MVLMDVEVKKKKRESKSRVGGEVCLLMKERVKMRRD